MKNQLVQISYNAYEPHLSILINRNHQAFSKYSTIVQYLDEPFEVWADKITALLAEELNQSNFELEYTGRVDEAEILRFFAASVPECVSFTYVSPVVNSSQQERMFTLNKLAKQAEPHPVHVTSISVLLDISFSDEERAILQQVITIQNRYCQMYCCTENMDVNSDIFCIMRLFDSVTRAKEAAASETADGFRLYLIRGINNHFLGLSHNVWIYEFDGSSNAMLQSAIRFLFMFPMLKAMRNCVTELETVRTLKEQLVQICTMKPIISVLTEQVIEVERSIPVQFTINPSNAALPRIVCEFDRLGVVDFRNSRLHGLKTGSVTAKFYVSGDMKPIAIFSLSVIRRNRIKELLLSETDLVLPEHTHFSLNYHYTPNDADNENEIVFLSENENIVSVTADGKIYTIQPGVCRIFCSAEVVTAYCEITVKPVLKSLIFQGQLKNDAVNLLVGDRISLAYQLDPKDCYDPVITFQSSSYTVLNIKGKEAEALSPGDAVLSVCQGGQKELQHWNVHIMSPEEKRAIEKQEKKSAKQGFFKKLFGG